MDDQRIDQIGVYLNSFDGGPLGPWDHEFKFSGELGCGLTLVGFVLFAVIVFVLSQYLFK